MSSQWQTGSFIFICYIRSVSGKLVTATDLKNVTTAMGK